MKTFNELLNIINKKSVKIDEANEVFPTIMAPHDIEVVEKYAQQFSGAFQSSLPNALKSIENELNKFGYTLGQLDLSEGFDDDGEEDFLIYTFATFEQVKNVFLTMKWEKISGKQFAYRQDGSKLRYDIELSVNRVSPAEMDELLSDFDDIVEEDNSSTISENNTSWLFSWKSTKDPSKTYQHKLSAPDRNTATQKAKEWIKNNQPNESISEFDIEEQMWKESADGELTDDEAKKKEKIVNSLKKKEKEFKDRYGDNWEAVMYATATKLAQEDYEIDDNVDFLEEDWQLIDNLVNENNDNAELDRLHKEADAIRKEFDTLEKQGVARTDQRYVAQLDKLKSVRDKIKAIHSRMYESVEDLQEQNGYVAFYGNQQRDVYANSSYEAYKKAVELFKPPKSKQHMVHVHLAEKDGKEVTHVATESVEPDFLKGLKELEDKQLLAKLSYYRNKDSAKYNAVVNEVESRGLKESVEPKSQSNIMKALHETMSDMFKTGVIDEKTMSEFDAVVNEAFTTKAIGRTLSVKGLDDNFVFTVHPTGELVVEIGGEESPRFVNVPKNKADKFMNDLMQHYLKFSELKESVEIISESLSPKTVQRYISELLSDKRDKNSHYKQTYLKQFVWDFWKGNLPPTFTGLTAPARLFQNASYVLGIDGRKQFIEKYGDGPFLNESFLDEEAEHYSDSLNKELEN